MKLFYYSFLFILISNSTIAQTIKGVVIDKQNLTPVSFALVSTLDKQMGTVADIDGKFSLTVPDTCQYLLVHQMGYESAQVGFDRKNGNIFYLKPKQFQLKMAVISAGENPADILVRKVVENRKRNDAENLDFYRCRIYSKLVIGGEADTSKGKNADDKKSIVQADSLFSKQYLFFLETANKRIRKGSQVWETVEGNRASGIGGSAITALLPQIQPFGFYDPIFGLDQLNYINPISFQSNKIYQFELTDTTYNQSDTLFVVEFSPKNKNREDLLKGVLYINKTDFALANVIAEPFAGPQQGFKIQQQFQKIGKQWFPYLIKTDFETKNVLSDSSIALQINIRSTVSEVSFIDSLKSKPSGLVGIQIDPKADQLKESDWLKFRTDTITEKETRTIEMIDSLFKANKLTWAAKALDALTTGEIPWKFINIDINNIFGYNPIEGFRLGFGFRTNQMVSQKIELGAYGGYGFKDQQWKYRGHVKWYIAPKHDLSVKVKYQYELFESGFTRFTGNPKFNSQDLLRLLYIRNMDYVQDAELSTEFRIKTVLKTEIGFRQSQYTQAFDYRYAFADSSRSFRYSELFASFKFKPGEKFLRKGNYLISLGSKSNFPTLKFQLTKGIKTPDWGDFDYLRIDGQISGYYKWRRLGQSFYEVSMGWVNQSLPMNRLFAPKANNNNNSNRVLIAAGNTFETMQPNEFLSSTYATLFFKQHAGRIITIKKFRPEWGLVHNMMWGNLVNAQAHQLVANRSSDNGFFESGLYISKIIASTFSNFGVAGFYRYGPYALPNQSDNFVFKVYMNTVF